MAGVPGAATVAAATVLSAAGLPLEFVAVTIPISVIADMARTATNVTAAAVSATVVARQTGLLDDDIFAGRKVFVDEDETPVQPVAAAPPPRPAPPARPAPAAPAPARVAPAPVAHAPAPQVAAPPPAAPQPAYPWPPPAPPGYHQSAYPWPAYPWPVYHHPAPPPPYPWPGYPPPSPPAVIGAANGSNPPYLTDLERARS